MEIDGISVLDSKKAEESNTSGFDFDEFLSNNKLPIVFGLVALIILGFGVSLFKSREDSSGVEIVTSDESVNLIVEVAGAVETPGVFELANGARIEDLLVAAGGVSANADRTWMDKTLNRAAKLVDGQKLYIPFEGEVESGTWQTTGTSANNSELYQNGASVIGTQSYGLTNINNASLSELDKLPGIGPVYGQRIIDQRPYSDVAELASKDIIPTATYDKIKNLISVY